MLESFALDPTIELSEETWNGVPFTAPYLEGLRKTVAKQQAQPPAGDDRCKPTYLAWLGNSQLHYIHRYQRGDHAAPYWLRHALDCRDATVPLGVSLPAANLQEQQVLVQYLRRRLPIRAIILQLSFDDLRGDGLRDDFSTLLDAADRVALRGSPAGAAALGKAEEAWKGRNRAEQNSGLEGFAQKSFEDALDGFLSRHWRMWADRKYLQTRLTVELYNLRNFALGIKATTLRRMIPARYERNMAALASLLQEAKAQGLAVLCYITPVRHDREPVRSRRLCGLEARTGNDGPVPRRHPAGFRNAHPGHRMGGLARGPRFDPLHRPRPHVAGGSAATPCPDAGENW